MKKGKFTITITIGIMCFILTMLIFMQVKTISQTDISELEIMRESELKTEITSLKTKYEEVVTKIQETNKKILEYEEASIEGKEASQLLQAELKETEDLLGKNSVTGEGIIIKMSNNGSSKINSEDLLNLVNILKNAGAEAISINEIRIVYDTYIVDINEKNHITIGGEYVVAPYTIKAIGNISRTTDDIRKYNRVGVEAAKEMGAEIDDLFAVAENWPIEAYADFCHFTDASNAVLGKTVAEFLRNELNK